MASIGTNKGWCISDCTTDHSWPENQCACRWFVKSAAVLEAAYEEVEAGRLIDHPKQATLQKVLTGIVTMQPVKCSIPHVSVYLSSGLLLWGRGAGWRRQGAGGGRGNGRALISHDQRLGTVFCSLLAPKECLHCTASQMAQGVSSMHWPHCARYSVALLLPISHCNYLASRKVCLRLLGKVRSKTWVTPNYRTKPASHGCSTDPTLLTLHSLKL